MKRYCLLFPEGVEEGQINSLEVIMKVNLLYGPFRKGLEHHQQAVAQTSAQTK